MTLSLHRAALFICALLIPFAAYSESDWFKIGNVRFAAKASSGWILQSTSDEPKSEDGDCNLVYQQMGGDQCNYGVIGIKIVNKNLSVTPQKKQAPNKKAETFAEFRDAAGFSVFYYESIQKAKKCRNKSYFSIYVYRINDTLDLNIFLSAVAVPEQADRMKFDVRNLVEDFFAANAVAINSLKPFSEKLVKRDSMSVAGNTLIFPVLPGWEVVRTYEEDKEDPTGRRWAGSYPGSESCPDPTLKISVDNFEDLNHLSISPDDQLALNFFIAGSKKNQITVRNIQIEHDSTVARVERQGYDTTSSQRVSAEQACGGEQVYIYSETFTIVFSGSKKNYALDFTIACSISDPVELQYLREQLKYMAGYLMTANNFAAWN